jgi:hypothetical protein
MAASKKPVEKSVEIQVEALKVGEATFAILGVSPLVFNSVSLKSRQELLFPRGRLTEAQKAMSLKHDPMEEYRASVYRRHTAEKGPTRLLFPCAALKGAMGTAALDMPTVAKTKIERLTWVVGHRCDVWGVPQLWMDVVRNADQARTPDIRTRAIVPEWAAIITVRFVEPMLSAQIVSRLLSWSGMTIGIGDARQEKGARSNGQFVIVEKTDPDFKRVCATGGAKVQDKALESPEFYDADTEELFSWFTAEYARRAQDRRGTSRRRSRKGDGDDAAIAPPPAANGEDAGPGDRLA